MNVSSINLGLLWAILLPTLPANSRIRHDLERICLLSRAKEYFQPISSSSIPYPLQHESKIVNEQNLIKETNCCFFNSVFSPGNFRNAATIVARELQGYGWGRWQLFWSNIVVWDHNGYIPIYDGLGSNRPKFSWDFHSHQFVEDEAQEVLQFYSQWCTEQSLLESRQMIEICQCLYSITQFHGIPS